MKISGNGLCVRIVDKGNFRIFKRSRLRNSHAQEEEEVLDSFDRVVEEDEMSSRSKVRDSLQELGRVLTMSAQETVRLNNGRTE